MRTSIFNQHSPPANVYEYRLAPNGSVLPKEGRKNMEEHVNIDTIADQMALATELDVGQLSDEDFERILATSPEQFTQDEEDTNPLEEIEAKRPLDS